MKRKLVLLVLSVVMLTSLGCALPKTIAWFIEKGMSFVDPPYTIVPDPTDLPPGFDSAIGSVELNSMYEPVQVSVYNDNFMPGCNIHYQAHAESGVLFSFVYDLEAGTFTGSVNGSAHADEYTIWETWGDFSIHDIKGTITRAENGQDYEFSGKGTLVITLKEQAKCDFQLGDPTVTEKEETHHTGVNVTGKIWHDGTSWRWSPLITDDIDFDYLIFFLRCINCDVTPGLP